MLAWSIVAFIWLVSGIKMCRSFTSFNAKEIESNNEGFSFKEMIPFYIIFMIGGWLWMVSAFKEK